MKASYPLAPMSPVIRALTLFVLSLPAGFVAIALLAEPRAASILLPVAALLALLWLGVWLWSRPTRFEVGDGELGIIWPTRRRRIPLDEITRTRVMSVAEFRKIYGYTPRIGVGGLFGAFGWLYSRHVGLIEIAASRLDGWVVIQRRTGRPIVCTPERPEEFAAALPGYESAKTPAR